MKNRQWRIKAFTGFMVFVFLASMAGVDIEAQTIRCLVLMGISGWYLYQFCKVNGYFDEKKDKKKTRRADTQASKKVIPFKNNTITIIHLAERKVK